MSPAFSRHDPESEDSAAVRELLSGLGDPRPASEDLVARITRSLEDERERGAPGTAGPGAVPLPPPTDHHPPSRRLILGLSAAAAVVALVGATGMHAIGMSSAETFGAALAGGREPAPAETITASPLPPQSRPHIQVSDTDYTRAALAAEARRLLSAPQVSLRPFAAESPAIGPIGTPIGVTGCLAALGLHDAAPLAVDIARFAGAPAAVIVTVRGGAKEVRVVERSCGAGASTVLGGPATID